MKYYLFLGIKYLLTRTTFQIFNLLVVTMLRLEILKDLQITMKSFTTILVLL